MHQMEFVAAKGESPIGSNYTLLCSSSKLSVSVMVHVKLSVWFGNFSCGVLSLVWEVLMWGNKVWVVVYPRG